MKIWVALIFGSSGGSLLYNSFLCFVRTFSSFQKWQYLNKIRAETYISRDYLILNTSNLFSFLFDKKKSTKLYEKITKIHFSCFFPTSYQKRRHMGHFKYPIWCKVQWTRPRVKNFKSEVFFINWQALGINSGNFILSIFMHRG